MNLGGLNKRLADARLVYLLAAALAVIGISAAVQRFNPTPQLMFVQTAEDLKADDKAHSLRLVNANQQTLYFSDRPLRIVGHIKMADYLKAWNQGRDSFAKDNPNATLSVFEPGRPETLVVVELSNPVVEGKDIVYNYKLLDGAMPASGGASTLFIDWVAARPGGGRGGFGRR